MSDAPSIEETLVTMIEQRDKRIEALQRERYELKRIYKAADRVAMFIGLDGEIHSRHEAVLDLMDAFHQFDGGTSPKHHDLPGSTS